MPWYNVKVTKNLLIMTLHCGVSGQLWCNVAVRLFRTLSSVIFGFIQGTNPQWASQCSGTGITKNLLNEILQCCIPNYTMVCTAEVSKIMIVTGIV